MSSDSDEDQFDRFDDILEDEERNSVEFIEARRYIGISSYDKQYSVNLLAAQISPKTFFQYPASDVMNYLVNYSVIRSDESCKPSPEIMQLHIDEHDAYTVILKTHWIRLVQRKWRNVLQQRTKMLRNPEFIRNRELVGNRSTKVPGLYCMLNKIRLQRIF
jgi:hypothetical protein